MSGQESINKADDGCLRVHYSYPLISTEINTPTTASAGTSPPGDTCGGRRQSGPSTAARRLTQSSLAVGQSRV